MTNKTDVIIFGTKYLGFMKLQAIYRSLDILQHSTLCLDIETHRAF